MPADPVKQKPVVGVSRCLLGDPVRYDGQSKANAVVIEQLNEIFDLVPVCPEVEAGLPVPRPPVQLTGSLENPRLTGRDDPSVDVTATLQAYCRQKPAELEHLSGFIFKSRSPSCGLNSTPVFIDGECISASGRGVFARAVCRAMPALPVIEDSALQDSDLLEAFIRSVSQAATQA